MLEAIITAKLSSGFSADLCKDIISETEHYEIHRRHPTGVVKLVSSETSFDSAVELYFEVVKELVVDAARLYQTPSQPR